MKKERQPVPSWGSADVETTLTRRGMREPARGLANLRSIQASGVPGDLMEVLWQQLADRLPTLPDPEMAVNNLDRFVTASRSPLALTALFERDPGALPMLLELFSVSQHLSDILVRDPAIFDLIRLTEGQANPREQLVGDLVSEVGSFSDERLVAQALRRFKHRETARIAYADLIRRMPLSVVTRQISYVADACCEAALHAAYARLAESRGRPRLADGQECRYVCLSLGKLGGLELNYSSDIDLILLYEGPGETDGRRSQTNQEFFERLTKDFIRLLTEMTDDGTCYRVDFRLRPGGSQNTIVQTIPSALRYYDVSGRTWERQAFVKARTTAGSRELGESFLETLAPWIYRRFLTLTEISGIKALKRKIEHRATAEGVEETDVKTGHGGIRDVEFVIQFLQLLNGADLPEVRTGNTLDAIDKLRAAGCLTGQEEGLLRENYTFLRNIEHRLQLLFDRQTHLMPTQAEDVARLAIRLGYDPSDRPGSARQFLEELRQTKATNRAVLNHLLHDAFPDDPTPRPEADLILDPDPTDETISATLGPYRFQDNRAAWQNLVGLAKEQVPFLSSRRCRHFLAAIAAPLLERIAATPDPDATLVTLARVSDSVGGKAVLWELFSVSPASLDLFVRLCAGGDYLSSLLISNPGMVDEVLDSLLRSRLPREAELRASLDELMRGNEQVVSALQAFRTIGHLQIGVRDLLGKDPIEATHTALANVAEILLGTLAQAEWARLEEKYGTPTYTDSGGVVRQAELGIVALGKLGAKEPNYHSDMDVIFLYDEDGQTDHRQASRATTNQHFFSDLGQRIIRTAAGSGPQGRLYEIDARLRPAGRAAPIAISLDAFRRYFLSGDGQTWERLALCKGRVVYGSDRIRVRLNRVLGEVLSTPRWRASKVEEIRSMRMRMQETASDRNIKRGVGGTVDVEFLVQMIALRRASLGEGMIPTGTIRAIESLVALGEIPHDDGEALKSGYATLRGVESALRLMNTSARHDVPTDERELQKLAYILRQPSGDAVEQLVASARNRNRALFTTYFDRYAAEIIPEPPPSEDESV